LKDRRVDITLLARTCSYVAVVHHFQRPHIATNVFGDITIYWSTEIVKQKWGKCRQCHTI